MEKKSNTPNVDELCVKYVFDELDPSETTLVEQAMFEDQNLLIEVESLKCTWRKLQKMPELEPPENISEAIINQAFEYSSQQQLFGNRWNNPGLLATAAVVILSLLVSTAYLLPGNYQGGMEDTDTRITGTGSMSPAINASDSRDDSNPLEPWLNRENFISIMTPDRTDAVSTPDSVANGDPTSNGSSREPLFLAPALRDFQLTGTNTEIAY